MVTRNEELARIRGFLDGYAGTAQDKMEVFLVSPKTKDALMYPMPPAGDGFRPTLRWQGVCVIDFDYALPNEVFVARRMQP